MRNTTQQQEYTPVPSELFADSHPANDAGRLPVRAPAQKFSLYQNQAAEPDKLYQLARDYLDKKYYDQAIAQFNRLLALNPENVDALNNLAYCLLSTGRLDLALRTYELALFLAPEDTEILRGIANCRESQGHFAEAITLYETILQKEPDNVECIYNLVLLKDVPPQDTLTLHLHRLHDSHKLPMPSHVLVCFALARVYEGVEDHAKAFTFYEEGNRLKFSMAGYNQKPLFDYLSAVEHVFNAQLFSQLSTLGNPDTTPLFVLGMPRSGTTLVEQILASHSKVHGAGELHTMPDIVIRLIPQLTGKLGLQAIHDLKPQAFAALSEHYLKILRSHAPENGQRIIDKMPANIFNIGYIKLLFPHARIIHCVRDPMDTCWSLYRQHFNGPHHYSYSQSALGKYYRRYQQLMQHWHTVLPGAIYDVRYEQLVQNPKTTVAGLLTHCGLEWEAQCLRFYETERAVSTASMRQVRQPLYTSSLHAWKPVENELRELRLALEPTS